MAPTLTDVRSKIKPEIVYFSQIFVIYIIIGTAIFNITTRGESATFWIGLLCSCLGYILPAPTLNSANESFEKKYNNNQGSG